MNELYKGKKSLPVNYKECVEKALQDFPLSSCQRGNNQAYCFITKPKFNFEN